MYENGGLLMRLKQDEGVGEGHKQGIADKSEWKLGLNNEI